MKSVNPYINFTDNCEAAFQFYQSVFGGELKLVRYKDLDNNMGLKGDDLNLIGNVMLPLVGDTVLYGSDVPKAFGQALQNGNRFEINIETESAEEAEQLYKSLAQDGTIKMPLQETEWAEQFGSCIDKYGVQWLVMFTGNKF